MSFGALEYTKASVDDDEGCCRETADWKICAPKGIDTDELRDAAGLASDVKEATVLATLVEEATSLKLGELEPSALLEETTVKLGAVVETLALLDEG